MKLCPLISKYYHIVWRCLVSMVNYYYYYYYYYCCYYYYLLIFSFIVGFLTLLHRIFTQYLGGREGCDYMYSINLCFYCHFALIVFSHIEITLLNRWAVPESDFFFVCLFFFYIYFILAGIARYFVYVFICPFLDHTQGSYYHWHDSSFKLLYFLNFYYQGF